MARIISIYQLYNTKRDVLKFEGEWKDFIGCPECKGSIIIWGSSGNGKTRFAVKFAKYLSTFKRVVYNSIEEGESETLKRAFEECGIAEDDKRIGVLDKASLSEVKEILSKHKSPDVVFIDSLQHWKISESEYIDLIKEFSNKLFVFTSHADGKEPKGALGAGVRFDANVKIYVDRFVAMPLSRCKGGRNKPFVIWEERARVLYGMSYDRLFENE